MILPFLPTALRVEINGLAAVCGRIGRVVATKAIPFCRASLILMAHVPALHDAQEGRQGPSLLALVRSVRVGRRVIQQTVAQLGELDERGRVKRARWRAADRRTRAGAAVRRWHAAI